jgi:hypothetical protein
VEQQVGNHNAVQFAKIVLKMRVLVLSRQINRQVEWILD